MTSARDRSDVLPALVPTEPERGEETSVRRLALRERGRRGVTPAREGQLRIAFVADTLAGWVGGGIVSGRRIVERLRAEHHQVIAVGAQVPVGPDSVQLPGFRLPLRAMRSMDFTMARPDRRRLREAFARVDLVHLHFPFWLSYAALREARALGLPVVASFHVQPENLLYNVGLRSPRLRAALYRGWVDYLYDRADAVVCPSAFAERKLREHGLRAPVYVVSNGMSPDLRPAPSEPRGAPDGSILVLAVGRLAPEKRQDVIVDAVARSRHKDRIRLVLAGAGHLEQALRERGSTLPHAAEVGFVDRARLERLFQAADVFVHASEVELEGMAVVEAMSMGLPVLVADSPESAAAAFALDDRFRFRPGDPESLAARLDALVEDPGLRRDAGARYAEAARSLDFGRTVSRLVDVYRAVLEGRPPTTTP